MNKIFTLFISILFLPTLFFPNNFVLMGGKLMGYWTSLCLRIVLSVKIELLGKIEHDDLKFYYSSCDLYVSASTFEVCPVPPIEAMSCGKPLLLFDIEPHVEIINASKAGKIFPSTNPNDISELVFAVLQNKHIFGCFSCAILRCISKALFSWIWELFLMSF